MAHLTASLEQSLLKVFSGGGLLQEYLNEYTARQEQVQMALALLHAYQEEKIALVEAATGVGKSWAYLVPALLFALEKGERTVISTHTIALQEQLIEKDIPFLLDVLDVDLQATLVKGMGNYFCIKKWYELQEEMLFFTAQELQEAQILEKFFSRTEEGSFSSLTAPISSSMWERVGADRSTCTHVECPHFKKCFFFKARRQLSQAQILVVNHHLLFADLQGKMRIDFQEEKGILPPFSRVVFDEAHHLEEIALGSFSIRIDKLELVRLLGRIYSDLQPQKSRLGQIKSLVLAKRHQISPYLQTLFDIQIPDHKRKTVEALEALVEQIKEFCQEFVEKDAVDYRWRLREKELCHVVWKEKVEGFLAELKTAAAQFFSSLGSLRTELKDLSKDVEVLASHLSSLDLVEKLFEEKNDELTAFIRDPFEENRVRWIEANGRNLALIDARLEVARHLRKHLFEEKKTAVLCSATLTSGRSFAFFKEQIGLSDYPKVFEKTYESPFDLETNTRLCIPKNFPLPHESAFLSKACAFVEKMLQVTKGGCFLLFTAYDMLEKCYQILEKKLQNFTCLKQGDSSKQDLLERFKAKKNGVLFATSSFWEGIDVPGDALSLVVIMKLPFRVPSDPLFQAISEMYERQGKDPFKEYSLPLAALRFTQGFGRLIRTHTDRGCVVCLDSRIKTKYYGKIFLQSIPKVPVLYETEEILLRKIEEFYSLK